MAQAVGGVVRREQSGTDQPAFAQWALTERVLLFNLHSLGAPLYQLTFNGSAQAQWQAGDLFEVLPLNDAKQSVRSYSIASIPAQGCAAVSAPAAPADGSPGLASFWLGEQLPVNAHRGAPAQPFELSPQPAVQ